MKEGGGRDGTVIARRCWAGASGPVPTVLVVSAGKKLSGEERRATQAALDAIVCHTPLNNLGYSRKGSALTIRVAFQALRAGLFEVRPPGCGAPVAALGPGPASPCPSSVPRCPST